MTRDRTTNRCPGVTSRRWLSVLFVAVCLASTAHARATTPTVAERTPGSVVLRLANSKAPLSPVPCWVVIEEEAHSGKVARRLLLLKPRVDLPCPGLLELQKTSDGASALRPAHCRLVRGTDGDTTLCEILDPTKAPTLHEGDRFTCSAASSTHGERPSRKRRSAP